MRDIRRRKNGKHASLAKILLLFDLYISLPLSLFFRACSNSLPTSTCQYLVVHSEYTKGWAAGRSAKD